MGLKLSFLAFLELKIGGGTKTAKNMVVEDGFIQFKRSRTIFVSWSKCEDQAKLLLNGYINIITFTKENGNWSLCQIGNKRSIQEKYYNRWPDNRPPSAHCKWYSLSIASAWIFAKIINLESMLLQMQLQSLRPFNLNKSPTPTKIHPPLSSRTLCSIRVTASATSPPLSISIHLTPNSPPSLSQFTTTSPISPPGNVGFRPTPELGLLSHVFVFSMVQHKFHIYQIFISG